MGSELTSRSWAVFLGEPTPTGAKVTGRLSVTADAVVFEAGAALAENAGLFVGLGIRAFRIVEGVLSIPLPDVAAVRVVRTRLILKSLVICLVSGEEIAFHFGAASPRAAHAAIEARLSR